MNLKNIFMNLSQHAILKVSLCLSVFRSINFPFSQTGVEVYSIAEKKSTYMGNLFFFTDLAKFISRTFLKKVSIFFFSHGRNELTFFLMTNS